MAKNTNRLGRVNEEIKKSVSEVINYELKNPDVTGMVSVTKVKVTPDLRYAKIYVSVLNSKNLEKTIQGLKDSAGFIRSKVAKTQKENLAILKKSSGYIRSLIAKKVNLRITPELVFEYDDSILYGEKIDNILKEIKEGKK